MRNNGMNIQSQLKLDREYKEKLAKFNLKFNHIAISSRDGDQWSKDAYNYMTTINGIPFEFTKGSGHFFLDGFGRKQAITPRLHEVLYSLILDIDCAEYDFEEFCDSLGYDQDSRHAERIYHQCVEQKEKVEKILSKEEIEELKEIFQDY